MILIDMYANGTGVIKNNLKAYKGELENQQPTDILVIQARHTLNQEGRKDLK